MDNSFQTWAKRAFKNNDIDCWTCGNWMIAVVGGLPKEVMTYAGVTAAIVDVTEQRKAWGRA